MSGTLELIRTTNGELKPRMRYGLGGHLDHGCFYAANSFHDPVSGAQIVWGWIAEEDLSDELRHRQGWSGLLSLPRQLRLQTLRQVTRAWASELLSITSIEAAANEDGTYTVRTLGSTPVPRVVKQLRRLPGVVKSELRTTPLASSSPPLQFLPSQIKTKTWELRCSISVSKTCRSVGLRIGHLPGKSTTPTSTHFSVSRLANSPSLPRLLILNHPHLHAPCRNPHHHPPRLPHPH